MAYQDIFRKIKDNIYIDKKIQIYRLHYNYLKTALKYSDEFKVDKSKYSNWDLNKVKTMPFDKWWKLKGMRLLGKELETVREIKTTSFNSRPNTIVVEIPTDVPFQFSLKQIKEMIKPKITKSKKNDERNHYLKLEDYLKTWELKKRGVKLKEIRDKLVGQRQTNLTKRKSRAAMDRTATEKYFKFDPNLEGNVKEEKTFIRKGEVITTRFGKSFSNMRSLERQVNRFKSHAQKILYNVCKGEFPGQYWK